MPKQIRHPSAPAFYAYGQGATFLPGVENLALRMHFTNPTYLFRGAGRLAGSLSLFGSAPVLAQRTMMVSGLGGTVAGQMFDAPLLNSDLSTVG